MRPAVPSVAGPSPFRATHALYGVLFLSGFAGLGYQSVWVRMLAQSLGHEYSAALGVVAAFFCGLGIGAFVLDRRISLSPRPDRWFAALEAVIALWALVLIFALPALAGFVPRWLGVDAGPLTQWAAAFLIPLVLLAPATVAMGATLPATDRLMGRLRSGGYALGGVYAANTGGAVLGVLGLTFVIAPAIGYGQSLVVLAVINAVCVVATLVFLAPDRARPAPPVPQGASTGVLATLLATGLLGIGFEVVAIRALAQILENTVYSFAAVLAVYLLGTAVGAALYHRSRWAKAVSTGDWLRLQAAACLLGVAGLWAAPELYRAARGLALSPTAASLLGELLAGAAVLVLPTLVMGAVFTHLVSSLRRADGGVGRGVAVNTLGAALAPVVVGVLIMPWLGVVATLVAIAVAYAALALPRRVTAVAATGGVAAVAALLVFTPARPTLLVLPEGATARQSIEGVLGTVNVYEDAAGFTHLKLNNGYVMGGTATLVPDRRQGHIPLLFHPRPRRALFLGVGTGATFAAAAYHTGVRADAVELVPEILDVLPAFAAVSDEIFKVPGLTLYAADARRFVLASRWRYDVIVADTFHPSRDGAGLLYTVAHFTAIRDRLAAGGVFVQWLPLHQLDTPTFKLIVRTFLEVFPDARATLNDLSLETPVIGLVGGLQHWALDWSVVSDTTLRLALQRTGLSHGFGPLNGLIAGPEGLARFAGPGPLNTDDHPRVVFEAPRSVYRGLDDPGGRLVALLRELERPAAADFLSDVRAARLEDYWAARDAFLALGGTADRHRRPDEMIATFGPRLLDVVRMSRDFAPAYDPLLAMAGYMVEKDPSRAYDLLRRLAAANPHRPEATRLIQRWFMRAPNAPVALPEAGRP